MKTRAGAESARLRARGTSVGEGAGLPASAEPEDQSRQVDAHYGFGQNANAHHDSKDIHRRGERVQQQPAAEEAAFDGALQLQHEEAQQAVAVEDAAEAQARASPAGAQQQDRSAEGGDRPVDVIVPQGISPGEPFGAGFTMRVLCPPGVRAGQTVHVVPPARTFAIGDRVLLGR